MGTFIISNIREIKRGGTLKTKKKRQEIHFYNFNLIIPMVLFNEKNQEKVVAFFRDTNIKDISFNISKSISIEEGIIDMGNYKGVVLWNGHRLIKIDNNGEIIKEREFNFDEIGIYMGDKIFIYMKSPP